MGRVNWTEFSEKRLIFKVAMRVGDDGEMVVLVCGGGLAGVLMRFSGGGVCGCVGE